MQLVGSWEAPASQLPSFRKVHQFSRLQEVLQCTACLPQAQNKELGLHLVAISLVILLMPLFVFSFWPIVEGLFWFLPGSSVLRPVDEFVKLRNYKDMLSDRIFRTAIVNTFSSPRSCP